MNGDDVRNDIGIMVKVVNGLKFYYIFGFFFVYYFLSFCEKVFGFCLCSFGWIINVVL